MESSRAYRKLEKAEPDDRALVPLRIREVYFHFFPLLWYLFNLMPELSDLKLYLARST